MHETLHRFEIKMWKLSTFVLLILLVSSCENQLDCNACLSCDGVIQRTSSTANSHQENGLYVFIYSDPSREYTTLGTLENDWMEQISKSGRKRKIGEFLKSAVNTIGQHASIDVIIEKMTTQAKRAYPNADGIIFTHKLMNAKVVKFKN